MGLEPTLKTVSTNYICNKLISKYRHLQGTYFTIQIWGDTIQPITPSLTWTPPTSHHYHH